AIQQFWVVSRDAAWQDRRFPSGGGGLVALKLAQDLKQAIGAMKLSARREMLPASKESHEVGAGYRVALFAQGSESEAMNAGENPAMAVFGFCCRREPALENHAFGFQFGDGDFNRL